MAGRLQRTGYAAGHRVDLPVRMAPRLGGAVGLAACGEADQAPPRVLVCHLGCSQTALSACSWPPGSAHWRRCISNNVLCVRRRHYRAATPAPAGRDNVAPVHATATEGVPRPEERPAAGDRVGRHGRPEHVRAVTHTACVTARIPGLCTEPFHHCFGDLPLCVQMDRPSRRRPGYAVRGRAIHPAGA